jgi:hypothetical protein
MEACTMERTRRKWGVSAVGLLLVVLGGALTIAQQVDVDPIGRVADVGWSLLVIAPGVVLLIASLVPRPPAGLGLAIAGAVVTTVGLLLGYQNATDHWESWAYAWTLVAIGAPGVVLLLYGLVFRRRDLWHNGLRLMAVSAALFIAGFWFFEAMFETGRVPLNVGSWWAVAVIAIGAVLIGAGVLGRRPRSSVAKS